MHCVLRLASARMERDGEKPCFQYVKFTVKTRLRAPPLTLWPELQDGGEWGVLPLPLREMVGLSLEEFVTESATAADSALCFMARSISTSLSLSVRKAAPG